MFSFIVLLFLSTSPWVVGVRGAPCTCFMLLLWQKLDIFWFLNSFPLSECNFLGKPHCQNSWFKQLITCSVCLEINGKSHENFVWWSVMCKIHLCLSLHEHDKLLISIKSIWTCERNLFAMMGCTTGFFRWSATDFLLFVNAAKRYK